MLIQGQGYHHPRFSPKVQLSDWWRSQFQNTLLGVCFLGLLLRSHVFLGFPPKGRIWDKDLDAVSLLWGEKAMAPHSSTPAWKIPWMEEPGGLRSMGSLRVGHDWATSLSLFPFTHWRRQWQPTPVFLPGESQGPGSLVDCRLWGRTESDTTEET